MLDAIAHGEFHRAVAGVRHRIDARLAPGVCGYRLGAEPGFSYSSEYRRFQDLGWGEAADAEWVVFADVANFFEGCTWEVVLDALARVVPPELVEPVATLAAAASASGLRGLPAGYADARLLANAVLVEADDAIELPFVRWVDDYRIFAATRVAADAALSRLGTRLAESGLSLNAAKVRVVRATDFAALSGATLESVYHPDVESANQVRAALRTLFLHAVQGPAVNRRELRFVLPRMAKQRDDLAVEYALQGFTTMPWETPRLAGYLAAFADRAAVGTAVEEVLVSTAGPSPWQASRLAALACHTGVNSRVADLVAAADATESPILWGLLVRALALSGHECEVERLTTGESVRDARAAVIARRDLGLDTTKLRHRVEEVTLRALGGGVAPRPIVDTLR